MNFHWHFLQKLWMKRNSDSYPHRTTNVFDSFIETNRWHFSVVKNDETIRIVFHLQHESHQRAQFHYQGTIDWKSLCFSEICLNKTTYRNGLLHWLWSFLNEIFAEICCPWDNSSLWLTCYYFSSQRIFSNHSSVAVIILRFQTRNKRKLSSYYINNLKNWKQVLCSFLVDGSAGTGKTSTIMSLPELRHHFYAPTNKALNGMKKLTEHFWRYRR